MAQKCRSILKSAGVTDYSTTLFDLSKLLAAQTVTKLDTNRGFVTSPMCPKVTRSSGVMPIPEGQRTVAIPRMARTNLSQHTVSGRRRISRACTAVSGFSGFGLYVNPIVLAASTYPLYCRPGINDLPPTVVSLSEDQM
jgi:hypothetical protein